MTEEEAALPVEELKFSDEQQEVIDVVLSGRSVFITGAAGVGKSFILREVIKILPPESTYVTASTGVAACNISGTTFHSFAGIGLGNAPYEELLKRATRRFHLEKWLKCRALVIDEISMIDGDLFETVERLAREIKSNDQPFGGIQLILCGDFLQLPPVQKEKVTKFCFEVPSWKRCVQRTVLLKKVFRQKDEHFIGILSRVRLGEMNLKDRASLLKCHFTKKVFDDKIHSTKLFPHRISCERVNESELQALPGECKVYKSVDGGRPEFIEMMDKYSRFPKVLSLKVGAQVMLLKNLSVVGGLVNGSRGVVIKFASEKELALENCKKNNPEQLAIFGEMLNCRRLSNKLYPVVRFTTGIEKLISEEASSIEIAGREVAFRRQVPLALAWAVSVHKAQGMTLERVDLSLKNVFECGQAYVALSRCTALEGLRLDDFGPDKVRAHPTVLAYYENLERQMAINKEELKCDTENRDATNSSFSAIEERIESIPKRTFNGFFQANRKASPIYNGKMTCCNKLFNDDSKSSPIAKRESRRLGKKRSVNTRVDFFAPKTKQIKINIEDSPAEDCNSIDKKPKLNNIAEHNSRPLVIID